MSVSLAVAPSAKPINNKWTRVIRVVSVDTAVFRAAVVTAGGLHNKPVFNGVHQRPPGSVLLCVAKTTRLNPIDVLLRVISAPAALTLSTLLRMSMSVETVVLAKRVSVSLAVSVVVRLLARLAVSAEAKASGVLLIELRQILLDRASRACLGFSHCILSQPSSSTATPSARGLSRVATTSYPLQTSGLF